MAELLYDGVDIRRADKSIRFRIEHGWIDEPADMRGTDTIVPGRDGRTLRPKRRDIRIVQLVGIVQAETAEGLFLLQLELQDLFGPTGANDLVVGDGYLGLPEGATATLSCRTTNVVTGGTEHFFMTRYSWELECIDNPPEWVFTGVDSSS